MGNRLLGTMLALALTAVAQAGSAGSDDRTGVATFAAGCFWCVEEAFDALPGVIETTSGYTGGDVRDPTYDQVSAGGTGHTEALRVRFDTSETDYRTLLETFWHNVDPTDAEGQFCDRGSQYRSGIFVHDKRQRRLAEASKAGLRADPDAPSPIVTPILEAGPFYPAEDYHQDYHRKNPIRYNVYKKLCGRANRLEELWGEAP